MSIIYTTPIASISHDSRNGSDANNNSAFSATKNENIASQFGSRHSAILAAGRMIAASDTRLPQMDPRSPQALNQLRVNWLKRKKESGQAQVQLPTSPLATAFQRSRNEQLVIKPAQQHPEPTPPPKSAREIVPDALRTILQSPAPSFPQAPFPFIARPHSIFSSKSAFSRSASPAAAILQSRICTENMIRNLSPPSSRDSFRADTNSDRMFSSDKICWEDTSPPSSPPPYNDSDLYDDSAIQHANTLDITPSSYS